MRVDEHGDVSFRQSPSHRLFDEMLASHGDSDDCLVWPLATKSFNGYGKVTIEGKQRYVHRTSCILAHGEPPAGHEVAHGPCHNRACFNPKHISWQTRKANRSDMKRDGSEIYGDRNGMQHVPKSAVDAIRAEYKPGNNRWHKVGPTMTELAEKYNTSLTNVHWITSGTTRRTA